MIKKIRKIIVNNYGSNFESRPLVTNYNFNSFKNFTIIVINYDLVSWILHDNKVGHYFET